MKSRLVFLVLGEFRNFCWRLDFKFELWTVAVVTAAINDFSEPSNENYNYNLPVDKRPVDVVTKVQLYLW